VARQFNLSEREIAPGTYSFQIDTPTRSDSVTFTLTRPGTGWPTGAVLTYQISERERGGELALLVGPGVMDGGDGPIGPASITIRWPPDKDKDLVQVDVVVQQRFTTAVNLQFD